MLAPHIFCAVFFNRYGFYPNDFTHTHTQPSYRATVAANEQCERMLCENSGFNMNFLWTRVCVCVFVHSSRSEHPDKTIHNLSWLTLSGNKRLLMWFPIRFLCYCRFLIQLECGTAARESSFLEHFFPLFLRFRCFFYCYYFSLYKQSTRKA